jgi:nucleosome-remodeling factor subunit BPTF
MKHMLSEVERRDKKREVNERRSASALQRAAKRDRRAAMEAQWKSRKDQEIFRKCENTLDSIIKQIERDVEGKITKSHRKKERDPNAPPKPKKKAEVELFCICRTPYDNDRFYIGCEVCQNWFHVKCVGMTEEQVRYTQYTNELTSEMIALTLPNCVSVCLCTGWSH